MSLLLVDLMVHQDLPVQVVYQDLVEHLDMEFHQVEHQVKF
jgi:hypothetical protein